MELLLTLFGLMFGLPNSDEVQKPRPKPLPMPTPPKED